MMSTNHGDWSPADNLYSIAVSESQWWRDSALLAIRRMRRNDEARVGWFSAQQIDARHLVFALRQLLSAEDLEQLALKELGIDEAVRGALTNARREFEGALPGIKEMRDGLMHFEDWARGMGRDPQKKLRDDHVSPRDVARHFWGFGFDPNAGTVSFGTYIIEIDVAERAATELRDAIYMAAREVDNRNTSERRAEILGALSGAGILYNSTDALLKVSPGDDNKIWLSLILDTDSEEWERRELAERIVSVMTEVGFHLEITNLLVELDLPERLIRGEVLYVRPSLDAESRTWSGQGR